MHKVLMHFRYSPDGLTTRELVLGETAVIRSDLAASLEAAGFIAPADGEPPVAESAGLGAEASSNPDPVATNTPPAGQRRGKPR